VFEVTNIIHTVSECLVRRKLWTILGVGYMNHGKNEVKQLLFRNCNVIVIFGHVIIMISYVVHNLLSLVIIFSVMRQYINMLITDYKNETVGRNFIV